MLSVINIWTIARYEMKTLLRSWFFRIFAGLVLIILTFFNIVFFAQAFETMPWQFRGIPASIPYFNMMLLNVAQAVIAVFLASDFLKRDGKSNTTQVIYMRSMSNADYILGKTIGLFNVFLGLNILMLVIAALIHVIFTDVVFHPMAYIYYLLLISIPTLIFIFGLSFFVMSLFRNQAVTFILLLGYFAVSIIVLNFKFAATFDAVAFFLPLSYSDFVGFSDFSSILTQRLAYLSLGLGFIFLTILLFKRLPQSKAMQIISTVLAVVLLAAGAFLFTTYFVKARSGEKLRADMIELNDKFESNPVVSLSAYKIDFEHNGDTFSVNAALTFQNDSNEDISELLFSLNPGLKVDDIELDGSRVNFTRDIHLLHIKPAVAIEPQSGGELVFRYSGSIDDRACYLTTPRLEREQLHELTFYKRGKQHSFVQPNYVLLTTEANWYPLPGTSQGTKLTKPRQKNFIQFSLKVKTIAGLTPISQGAMTENDDVYEFTPEQPLTQLSLVIGHYLKRSIEVDDVTYNLYTHEKHDFFVPYVTEIADTLESMIRELKNDYELKTKVDYPFKSFSLVEAPIHFKTFGKPLSFHQDWVQPGQVFLPENGAPVDALDFKRHVERSLDRMEDRNETISETELHYQIVRRFVETELFGTRPNRRFGGNSGQTPGLFVIFPNFYTFRNGIVSIELPILDAALEAYLKSKVESLPFKPSRFQNAFSDGERANIALKDHSLQEILADPENVDIATIVLKSKSDYLFRLIESKIGMSELETFLTTLFNENEFSVISMQDFVAKIQQNLNIPFENELSTWYRQNQVPGFYITDVKNYKILDGDRTRYQISLNIYNPETVAGVVLVDFIIPGGGGPGRGGGFGRFNFGASEYQRSIYMAPEQTKLVGFVLDDEPRMMTIKTLVSRNLPSENMRRMEDFEENNKMKPFDGEKVLDAPPVLSFPGEIIVDNEEDGFTVESVQQQSALKRLLKIKRNDDEEYVPFSFWRAPTTWRKTFNTMFYGDFEHSAHFIRAGDGDKKVTWETELERAGHYEVFVYGEKMPFRGRGRRRGGDIVKSFHYSIHHDDGVEEVEWDPESAQGWNYLGTFYFSSGTAKIELTNESQGRIVVADAVKWVKK